jgi:ABC-type polysaccharide/polyol phosphate transport system, ATPase component
MSPIITVKNISKCYTISHQGKRNDTLRDEMSGWIKNMTRRRTQEERSSREEFWALKNVSFDIEPGDRVGIIGRNGAGKSTLLKILSRITEPTKGEIRIRGRVASLLEVGTGFHAELSGRENIYLNGAILGMSRVEIKKKFDEIVAFSEVEKFLDTPVKRYSSGMYVRLAFAVAAHLEPEILIVDEVLAVGDAPFQKKCLGKMEDVGKEGRTVLFVSHQMDAIRKLCEKTIWLVNGQSKEFGQTSEVVLKYEDSAILNSQMTNGVFKRKLKLKKDIIQIESAEFRHKDRGLTSFFSYYECVYITLIFTQKFESNKYILIEILDESGKTVSTIDTNTAGITINPSNNSITCQIKNIPYYMQKYQVIIGIGENAVGRIDTWNGDVFFEVISCDPYSNGHSYDRRSGCTHIHAEWINN